MDLAIGHVRATDKLKQNCGFQVYNLGTGTGYSVLDMVKAFEKASGQKVCIKVTFQVAAFRLFLRTGLNMSTRTFM